MIIDLSHLNMLFSMKENNHRSEKLSLGSREISRKTAPSDRGTFPTQFYLEFKKDDKDETRSVSL